MGLTFPSNKVALQSMLHDLHGLILPSKKVASMSLVSAVSIFMLLSELKSFAYKGCLRYNNVGEQGQAMCSTNIAGGNGNATFFSLDFPMWSMYNVVMH